MAVITVNFIAGNLSLCIENLNGTGLDLGHVLDSLFNHTLWFDSDDGDWTPIYNDTDFKIDNDNEIFDYTIKKITEAKLNQICKTRKNYIGLHLVSAFENHKQNLSCSPKLAWGGQF